MSDKIKVGTKLNLDNNEQNVTILERNSFYCFYEGVTNSNKKYWNAGIVFMDRNDNEGFRAGIMNDSDMYLKTKEEVYTVYKKNVQDMNNRIKNEAEVTARELAKDNAHRLGMLQDSEATSIKIELRTQLQELVKKSDNIKSLLKDKKVKELLESLALVNTLLQDGISFE